MDVLKEMIMIIDKLKAISHIYKNKEYFKIEDLCLFFELPEKRIVDNIFEFEFVLGYDYGVIENEFVIYFDGIILLSMTLTKSKTAIILRRFFCKLYRSKFV